MKSFVTCACAAGLLFCATIGVLSRPGFAVEAAAPAIQTPVYVAGSEGYKSFRIPSLLVTKKGTVLAFCEGRKNSGRDAGDIDLLLRRSSDGGKSWAPMQIVWDDKDNTCGNPCPIVDSETGDIVLLMTRNRGEDVQKAIEDGTSKETRTVWVTRSHDDGASWSAPRDITPSVKKADWRWYATGPGIGIQVREGKYKGRMVVPCDHSEKSGGWSHTIYSDDHGETWHLGGVAPQSHTDECQLAELPGGSLILNMRAGSTKEPSRAVCVSDDGGETWKDFRHDPALIESRCEGSIISLQADGKPALLFSNPADNRPKSRTHMTVRLSFDDGKTWPRSLVLQAGPAAYSCLTVLPGGEIGCLYERGEKKAYDTITLARFPLAAVTNTGSAAPSGTL